MQLISAFDGFRYIDGTIFDVAHMFCTAHLCCSVDKITKAKLGACFEHKMKILSGNQL